MTSPSTTPEPVSTPPPRRMRLGAILLFGIVGALVGAVGGLLLPSFHGRQIESLDLSALGHLALLGALMASAGPLVERHWRKLFVAWVAGGAGMILLALAVMGIAQLNIGGLLGLLVVVAVAALYPAIVALADCLADDLYRTILYETTFSALGGVVGLACAWPVIFLQNERTRVALVTAIYGGIIWLMMGLAKWEEESEENMEQKDNLAENAADKK